MRAAGPTASDPGAASNGHPLPTSGASLTGTPLPVAGKDTTPAGAAPSADDATATPDAPDTADAKASPSTRSARHDLHADSDADAGTDPAPRSTPAPARTEGQAASPPAPDAPASSAVPVPAAAAAGTPPRTLEIALKLLPGFEAQLAVRAREFLESGRTEIRVALDPPSLGKVKVHLSFDGNDAVARITAATPEAAAALSRDRAELLRMFQQQGFQRVDVHVDSDGRGDSRPPRDETDDDRRSSPVSAVTPAPSLPAALRSGRVDLFV